MDFGKIIKSVGKALNPVQWIGDIIGAGTSLITSNAANKNANHLADKQMAAQKEMNAFNVASQEKINQANIDAQERLNQSQIDFQRDVNSIMRRDNMHSISDKRNDLMRGGYSTADPSLSGHTAASLGVPSLTAPQSVAPQVQSEFDSSMASNVINARSSHLKSSIDMATALTNIALQKAQTKKTDEERRGLKTSNDWLEVEKQVQYKAALVAIDNGVADGVLKRRQADKLLKDMRVVDENLNLLKESVESARTQNKYLDKQLFIDLQSSVETLIGLDLDNKRKKIDIEIADFDRQIKEIETKFAKLGINFNGSDFVNSIARIAMSGHSGDITRAVFDAIKDIFGTTVEEVAPLFEPVVDTVKSIVDHQKSPTQSPTSPYYRSLGRYK